MKKRMSWLGLGVLGVAFCAQQGMSQDAQSASPEQMQVMMQEWMAMQQPGDEHKQLQASVGEWDLTMTMWYGGPGSEPTKTTGKSVITAIMGGRFIEEKMSGNMLMPGADGKTTEVPFEGVSIMGYDKYKQMYTSFWIDDSNTAMTTMRGSRDPKTGVLTLYGEMDEPMLDVKGRMVRATIEQVSKDKAIFTMYDLHVGEAYKTFEIIYARAK